MRGWMAGESYKAAVEIDGPMHAGGVGVVKASTSEAFVEGDLVQGMLNL